MKINNSQFELLSQFNKNWEQNQKRLCLDLSNYEINAFETHPLIGEIVNLIQNKKGGSLPFFSNDKILWCTLAPNPSQLQIAVDQLQNWILPSYGWLGSGDGYKIADSTGSPIQKAIADISQSNYFRWQSNWDQYAVIERKLAIRYQLELKKPDRLQILRPSLYDLRSQFQTALTLGNRNAAEKAIDLIDTYELDKALNTEMMRIRLWHHFREFENIKNSRKLPYLLSLPFLPTTINECIKDATVEISTTLDTKKTITIQPVEVIEGDWESWFNLLINQSDMDSAKDWLGEKKISTESELSQQQIRQYAEFWDSIFINDFLKEQNRHLISEGIVNFIGDFIREPEFPRTSYAELYLSLLRLWGDINAGINKGREEGHVLLELACALFQLNHEINEVKMIVEDWWKARAVPSQLPFVLDAIELLTYQHPDTQASANLWIEAADQAKRNPEHVLESEKNLWRIAGTRIGLDEETILEFFPVEREKETKDILSEVNLNKIAIVCMREEQARVAAGMINTRTNAKLLIVSGKVAGKETDQARFCDVVLFVYMATTHAVFRAFDGFDRKKLCYVQGTGPASIVRSLERWALEISN